MTSIRNQRPGVTLTEVLVALFVMAIGMIALLTLFPLGAMQLSQAIKDDRTAQAGYNADYLMRTYWRQYVVEPVKNGRSEQSLVNPYLAPSIPNPNYVPFMTAMENPNADVTDVALPPAQWPVAFNRSPPTGTMPPLSDPNSWTTFPDEISRPSYPVFVDPYGDVARQTGALVFSRRWVAGVHPNSTGGAMPIGPPAFPQPYPSRMPRRSLNFPGTLPGANWQYRYATLADDMEFGQDGASNSDGTGVSRTGRYNWTWVLQRPAQGNRLNMDMTVVVYDRRAFNFARLDEEVAYPADFYPGSNTITFQYNPASGLPAPAIRSGQWIMDGTITPDIATVNPTTNPPVTPPRPIRNANFYRVTSVTDDPATGIITFDLQTPIKSLAGITLLPGQGYQGQLYVLNGVSEVFERRQLTTNDSPEAP